jgi:hypothetical protein
VTGGESWFDSSSSPAMMSCIDRDEVEDPTDYDIDTQNTMVTIFWGLDGFHVIGFLCDAYRLDSQYFCDLIFPICILNESMPCYRVNYKYLPRLIYMDDASPDINRVSIQKLECHDFEQMLHPPYSVKLAHLISFCSDVFKLAWLIDSVKLKITYWHH